MVQSSRLNNNLHPLLPIVAFITMVIIIGLLFVPRVLSGITKPIDRYERERSKLLSEYYKDNVRLTTLLTSKYSSVAQYKSILEESKVILDNQQVSIAKISSLNIAELKLEKSQKNRDIIEENIIADSRNFEFTQRIINTVSSKLESLETYSGILDYDSCIKKIKDKYNLDNCRNLYKEIELYGAKNSYFTKLNNEFLYSYNELSKNERISHINRIVKISNGFISDLEEIINKPISLK